MTTPDAMLATTDTIGLPALIDRARQRLAEARTSAEVLEAKAIAEAALHYAKLTRAANETHADCLRMIVRAEMRMATEIDRGQERGEVATAGGDRDSIVRSPDNGTATLDDLGVSRQRLAEWRETRDAGEDVVEQAIGGALGEGRPPTKADIQRAAKTRQNESQPPKFQSRVAVEQRKERMREMATEGYTSQQIAAAVGLTVAGCRDRLRVLDIDVPADRAVGKTQRHDSTRIVEHIVMDAENLTADVNLIDFAELDRARIGEWLIALKASRIALGKFIDLLTKEHQRNGEAA